VDEFKYDDVIDDVYDYNVLVLVVASRASCVIRLCLILVEHE